MPSFQGPGCYTGIQNQCAAPDAAEDSDLISALTKLVNEVYSSAKDGLWAESWMTVQANSVCQPAAPSNRGIGIGRELD
jgi:hypothetical protein